MTNSLRLIDNLLQFIETNTNMTSTNNSNKTKLSTNWVKPYTGHPQIILGCMEHGRRLNEQDSISVTQKFLKRGLKMVDTAYMYAGGKSEKFLGNMRQKKILTDDNSLVATKVNPARPNTLTYEGIRKQFKTQLSRLQMSQIDILYLHWPDNEVDISESLRAINDLYKEKKFLRFGLSNYSSWQVAEIYYLCKINNYVLPTVYQGMYNPFCRQPERELFPCLRRYNIVFYGYSPLAGGMLSGKYKYSQLEDVKSSKTGRFAGPSKWAGIYRDRFWNISYFKAIDNIKNVIKECYGNDTKVTFIETVFRWLTNHSQLGENDGVILGAGSTKHFDQNLDLLSIKEPLHENIVKAFDEAWYECQKDCPTYFR